MTPIKKIMLSMSLLAGFATISASTQQYTPDNINAWIAQTAAQIATFQNIMTKADTDVQAVATLLNTMASNLQATPNSSVQSSQITQLNQNIASLQSLLTPYAYIFTNNAPFPIQVNSIANTVTKDKNPLVTIDPQKTSNTQYSTSIQNIFAASTLHSITCGGYSNGICYYHDNIEPNASYNIVLQLNDNVNQLAVTKTSDSGKNYTNTTEYHIKMISKPHKHNHWSSPFELDPGQSTGPASNDEMNEIKLYPPSPMPQSSTPLPSVTPGHYVITYDKGTNKLSMAKS